MILSEIKRDSNLYHQALDLRYTLFFKDYGLDKSITADDLEGVSIHVVLSDGDKLIAYGRLSPLPIDEVSYRISQIVVEPDHQRNGYALIVLRELIRLATQRGGQTLVLNAQLEVIQLYKKLGFKEDGEIYVVKLTGVKHQRMVLAVNRFD
jgi:predicted GNAT family N-acyltransferase